MKILHVITSLYTGGAEKLMVDLLPRLRDKGIDVELLAFDGTMTAFRRELEAEGITVHDLGAGGSVYSLRRLLNLSKFMRGYDIIHTHNTAPQLYVALQSVLCSVVLCTTEHNTSNRKRAWRWYAPIDRWMYGRYKRVICISKKAEENLRKFIGNPEDNRILTVNNGVDVAKVAGAIASDALESIAPNSRKLLMVAGMRWEKDQDTIIRTMKHLPEVFHFFMAGDGVRRSELEKLTRNEGVENRVHFLGLRRDVPSLLHEADYILMSSHFEGLSLSSVEGMAAGRPMLASDVDGLREVVGGAGILFPHGDAETLADEIMKLENNPYKYAAVAESCRKHAADYDISRMVEGYTNVYNSLIRNEK